MTIIYSIQYFYTALPQRALWLLGIKDGCQKHYSV